MKKEKGDRLYTVMTVLAVLAFRGHYYFLVIDYNLINRFSLYSLYSDIMADSLLYGKKENQYWYMYKNDNLVISILLGCDILIWLFSPI